MDHEFLTVVDGNDLVLGYSTREDIQRRGLNYRCVQVFLFNTNTELLLCRRPDNKKKFASQFASVMGHVRKGEGYEDAAYREVREELGINTKLRKITKFSVLDGASRVWQELYVGGVAEEIHPDKTEISDFKFSSIQDLRTDIVTNSARYAPPFIEAVRAYIKANNMY